MTEFMWYRSRTMVLARKYVDEEDLSRVEMGTYLPRVGGWIVRQPGRNNKDMYMSDEVFRIKYEQ